MDNIHLLSKRGKVIGVKDKTATMKIVADSTVIYYFLHVAFIVNIFIITYFLLTLQSLGVIYSSAFLIVILIAMVIEKRALFLKISYPFEGVININENYFNYEKNDIRIFLVGVQPKNAITKYNYMLHVVENEEMILSIKLNYSKEKKIRQFIDNLIIDNNVL